jgi:hypothetical protein
MKTIDRGTAVARLKEIAARLGKTTVTRQEFARETGLSLEYVKRRLGRYSELVRDAGLQAYGGRNPIPDEDLLAALREAALSCDGHLTLERFERHGRHSFATYRKRFGTWVDALSALVAWLETNEPGFPFLAALRQRAAKGRSAVRATLVPLPRDERAYGRMVGLPTLLHAPLTENGVIYLFGALASELGFVVEAITSGYPDCLAKRRLDRDGERWTRVRIEFEQASRNFKDHGHDPAGCDLIVCWEHNWSECPVEVLELKKVASSFCHPRASLSSRRRRP